ncbi:MAG TPA: hydrogenase formation protein HypD, partial [Clostridiales bacterium]|nr:hydrogenase formation protein HypD [Clostridiales bacterium]
INTYKRCVRDTGNPTALCLINEVFRISDVSWRGIGMIQGSALTLNHRYEVYDAAKRFNLKIETTTTSFPDGCECGKILIGEKTPNMCVNFGCLCTPDHPLGPCMTSSEGACAAYYRYGGSEN